jgi:hypothetical protein
MAHDDENVQDEPPGRPRRDKDEPSDADEKEQPYPLQKDDELELEQPRRRKRRRRRRDRSILRSDEPTTPFTLQQGWLDGLFTGPNLIVCLAVAFFCSPLAFWVALFAAITAADSEARRNAFVVVGFCLIPVLLAGCVVCLGKALHPD